jgi:hypothetical protein
MPFGVEDARRAWWTAVCKWVRLVIYPVGRAICLIFQECEVGRSSEM